MNLINSKVNNFVLYNAEKESKTFRAHVSFTIDPFFLNTVPNEVYFVSAVDLLCSH